MIILNMVTVIIRSHTSDYFDYLSNGYEPLNLGIWYTNAFHQVRSLDHDIPIMLTMSQNNHDDESNNNDVTDQRLLGLAGQWCEPQSPRLWGTRLLHFQIIKPVGETVICVIMIMMIVIIWLYSGPIYHHHPLLHIQIIKPVVETVIFQFTKIIRMKYMSALAQCTCNVYSSILRLQRPLEHLPSPSP